MEDFSGLLSSVIANTQARRDSALSAPSGPRIVSQEHDTAKINLVAGMSDPGEMIGCGQYQELRRMSGESDTDYQARLTVLLRALPEHVRKRIHDFGVQAANRRAGYDTTTGRVDVVINVRNKPSWAGLGTLVDGVMTSEEVQQLALNWSVRKDAMFYRHPLTGEMVADTESFAITRTDTGAKLGTVGTDYVPFQNAEAFRFLDSVLGEFGARYESAGALYGGKKIWALVHLPQQDFTLNGTDRNKAYACFTNTHNGRETAKCFATNVRVECANTLRQSVGKDKGDGITIRHTGNLTARVKAARAALALTVQAASLYKDAAEAMTHTRCEPEPFFHGLLDAVCAVTQAQSAMGAESLARDLLAVSAGITQAQMDFEVRRYNRAINARSALLTELAETYDRSTNGIGGMRGTAWAALNAATEAADHGTLGGHHKGDRDTRSSAKFESILNGAADRVKQVAYQHAVALVS